MLLVILLQALSTILLAAVGLVTGSVGAGVSALVGGFAVAAPTAVLVGLLRAMPQSEFPTVLLVGEVLRLIAVAVLLVLAVRFLVNPNWGFFLAALGASVLVPLLYPLLQRWLFRRHELQKIEDILRRNNQQHQHHPDS